MGILYSLVASGSLLAFKGGFGTKLQGLGFQDVDLSCLVRVKQPRGHIRTFSCHLQHVLAKSYSHSMVPGGLLVISYTTRLMPFTSLTIRVATRVRKLASKG